MEGKLSYRETGEDRLFSNNSDEENEYEQNDQDILDDFVSFPTIPDPDQEHSKTLTKIFSKTLRKVTSNAHHLVQNYSSPKSRTTSGDSYHDRFPESPVRMPTLTTTAIIQPETDKVSQKTIDNTSLMSSRLSRVSSPIMEPSSGTPQIRVSGLKSSENISKSPSNSDIMGIPGISNNSKDDVSNTNKPNQQPMHVRSSIARTDVPKVKSDNKSLRLSSMRAPHLSYASMNNSATSSVINVSALASTDKGETSMNMDISTHKPLQSTNSMVSNVTGNNNTNDNNTNNISQKDKQKILQNRISSIFNNLPNDIELSEDSASDLETINNVSISPSTSHANIASINAHDNLLLEEKPDTSPIRNRSQNVQEYSPTSIAFTNFRNLHDKTSKKKSSSNIPSLILDNAKSIINSNITGSVVSSASSIVTSRSRNKNKKKKKPRKSSENPLKNGGIPKQYWMNDAFVSDCLNCFKPFTAFRRKHHCRFCGQIYCSDCTLFISYTRHKEERKMGKKSDKRHFNDKLRVCKGCYNDVIVYLSDDSSSSSSNSDYDSEVVIIEENENLEEVPSPQLQLSRIRSLSISSRRDSLINEANIKNANKSFINKDYKSILDKANNSITEYPGNDDADYSINFRKHSYPANVDSNNMKPYIKQAPQMAIPATRKGEAVEIPIPKSSYTNSILSHNIIGDAHFTQSPNNEPLGYNNTSWFKNYTHLKAYNLPSSSESKSNSFNSHMYNPFLGKRKINRYSKPSSDQHDYHSMKTRNKRSELILQSDIDTETSNEEDEGNNEDIESENEDEQVMSLYSSLNHIDSNNSTTTSALSPRQPGSHTLILSNTAVPTLGEFPTMFANEKLFQRNFTKRNSKSSPLVSKLFQNSTSSIGSGNISNSNDSHSNGQSSFPFLDEKPNDSLRSHERAHASLLRMRSRRKSKSARNVLILTHNNNKLQGLDTSLIQYQSPISTPTSPRPTSQTSSNMASNLTKGLSNDDTPTFIGNSKPYLSASSVPILSESSPTQTISPNIPKNEPTSGISKSLSSKTARSSSTDIADTASIRKDILSVNDIPSIDFKPKELIYRDFLDTMMKQCLEDCEIKEDQERWCKALKKVLSYINYIKLTDTIDIRQYVKIKKILGGTIEETNVIDGMFATKNIDSKRMSSKIENPKIALLMFPLEYLKQKEQFISLRIVHSQQSVYITNLVSRLIALEPDIIIVGDSVCGFAEKLLLEANITVISNTKPQVIERISRYTKANIFQSINDLFFKKGSLGTCEKFEVRKYLYDNVVKSFIFFTGGDIESGFTIALRGGEENVLNSVKYTAETLVIGVLNSKFEISLLENHGISILDKSHDLSNADMALQEIQKIEDERNANNLNENNACEIIMDNLEVTHYVKIFSERSLSVSPAVTVELPSALVNVIASYKRFFEFFKTDTMIQSLDLHKDIEQDWLNELNLDIDITRLPNEKLDLINILKYASEFNLKVLTNEFQSRARIWSNCMTFPSYQLYPVFHKSIHFLHSTVSIKYATPCSGPSTVVIDYYTDNDKCLGLFLDQIFRDSLKTCDECGDSLLNHYKTYVHGNVKLDVIIEKYENVFNEDLQEKNQRLMWSSCKICDYSSPIKTMNDETYYLSVGKFLELCFGAENVTLTHSACNHDFFKQHIRYFALNDSVIRMEYSDIDTYEVVVPKKQLEYLPDIDIKLKIETFNQIQKKSANFFQSISNRLNRVKVDTFDKADDGMQKVEELKIKLDEQVDSVKSKTLEIYNSTLSTIHLPLNSVLRELQELGVIWDNEFNEFEKSFLPTENEITKITQFHLKKFLMDKYNSEGQNKETEISDIKKRDATKDNNADETETDSEIDTGTKILNNEKKILKDSIQEDRKGFPDTSLNKEKTKEIGKMIPSSLYGQSNVVDKINKMEALLESERKSQDKDTKSLNKKTTPLNTKSPQVSTPTGSDKQLTIEDQSTIQEQPQNKVSQIANFFNQMNFDQISMEFRKQREEELQKKLNKFKALPIVASKPIVEIYDKIEDVVDVNDENDLDKKNLKRLHKKSPSQEPGSGKVLPALKDPEVVGSSYKTDEGKVQNKEKEKDKNKDVKNLDIPQPEKNSLLKSLTNFWADRSATLWDPLEYPLDSSEHTFADSDVIVREDEPSSLVAFCLSSHDYKQKIKSMGENTTDENIEINETNNKKFKNFTKIEKKFKTNYGSGARLNEFESIMIKNKSNHLKYQYLDGNTNLSCKIFYSEQFDAFRKACGNDETFIQSLSRCVKWNSSGGKSGSNFLKTLDARYILKELSKSELESFVSIAPFYFKYISQSMFHTLTTAVAKIFGFYQIQIKNTITGKTFKMDFLIMENLFYNHNTTRIFDLKGSMRNRHVKQTGEENEVLLDENMIEYIYESPVFVKEHLKKLLRGSLFNDTSFLSAMDVMDYSLIIGIDDSSKKLYIGIIDWLRTFTWDKKVENWVKGNNLIGGGKKGKDPTIVTPKQYRTRFREAMERYILEVPDFWYEGK
ncbi:unnamed protein product [Debaryomyces fabryi]|nr:unnamed protein product [Debaryomyces fabryi]